MTKQIPLSGSVGQCALIDDDDYAAASTYSWHSCRGYATTKIGRKNLRLHTIIAGDPPAGFVVDHIDGDPLNNQRANLRWATFAQNIQNKSSHRDSSSRFKGVSWNKRLKVWAAQIYSDKKYIYLGIFTSELDAARAYNAAAAQHFGEYARLNVIPDDADGPVRYRQAVPNATNNRTSKYRGVSFSFREERWRAAIGSADKIIHLGHFDTEEAAARAYDSAAKLHHGTRAFLNFLD